MKKRISAMLLFFMMLILTAANTVYAKNGGIYDDYGMLSEAQYRDLNEKIQYLQENYPIEGAVVITDEVYTDSRHYAAEFMQDREIGYGDIKDGFCLLNEPTERNITLIFRGTLQYYFKDSVRDRILDDCTEKLRANDYCGAYECVVQEITNCMNRVIQGKEIRPMDISGEGLLPFLLMALGGSFGVMVIPTLIMTLMQKSKMNMIVPQQNADCYIPENGFILRRKTDQYIRTNVIRTAKPKDEDRDRGSSGSFSSRGESFSGSSRKY